MGTPASHTLTHRLSLIETMSSYRGRGSRGRPSNFSQSRRIRKAADHPGDRDITDGLLPVPSQTLRVPKDKTLPPDDVKVENLQYLGSYNWVKGSEDHPTMIVPGTFLLHQDILVG